MNTERRTYPREKCRIRVRVFESSAGWAVEWKAPAMPLPSRWYFDSEERARREARLLQAPYRASQRAV